MKIIALFCAVLLTACTTVGHRFEIEKVDQLRPGVSTLADAQALLGTPTSRSELAEHRQVLQWFYVRGSVIGGSGEHVAIVFDGNGRMLRVAQQTKL